MNISFRVKPDRPKICSQEASNLDVLHIITGLGRGGAELTLLKLVENCNRLDFAVISLKPVDGSISQLFEESRIPLVQMNFSRGLRVSEFLRLMSLIKYLKPPIVQTWMYHADLIGGIAARIVGVETVIWSIRGMFPIAGHEKLRTLLVARLLAILSRFIPTEIVACGERARESHIAAGYRKDRFSVIPNGFKSTFWYRDREEGLAAREEFGIQLDKLVVGMIGRYHPKKNHRNFIEAVGLLKSEGFDFIVVFAGAGLIESNGILASQLDKNKLSHEIRLLGERNDVRRILNALDVLVLPSESGEGFPNILAEAMLTEKLCIAADSGDASSILGESGILLRDTSAREIRNSLISVLQMETSAREQLGTEGRTSILSRFSLDRMIQSYSDLYRNQAVCNRRG